MDRDRRTTSTSTTAPSSSSRRSSASRGSWPSGSRRARRRPPTADEELEQQPVRARSGRSTPTRCPASGHLDERARRGSSSARWRAIAWKSALSCSPITTSVGMRSVRASGGSSRPAHRAGRAASCSSARRCCGRTKSRCGGATQKSTLSSAAASRSPASKRGLHLPAQLACISSPKLQPGKPEPTRTSSLDAVGVGERRLQRDRAAERVADEHRRQQLRDAVDVRERRSPAAAPRRSPADPARRPRTGPRAPRPAAAPEPRVAERRVQQHDPRSRRPPRRARRRLAAGLQSVDRACATSVTPEHLAEPAPRCVGHAL